jgi:photosystem II stability/assembly factor-like uncharacterized protein
MKNLLLSLIFLTSLLYKTSFSQSFWQHANGPYGAAGVDISVLAVDSNDNIIAATWVEGNFISTDKGISWNPLDTDLGHKQLLQLAINSDGHLFGISGGSLLRSTNNGKNWIQINNSISDFNPTNILINSTGEIFVASLPNGIYKSTNNGDTWVLKDSGFTNAYIPKLRQNSLGHIFAITHYDGIYHSIDSGESWIRLNDLFEDARPFNFTVSNDDIFVSEISGGVFRSTDNGNSWDEVSNGLPGYYHFYNGMISSLNGYIFIWNADGIYRSSNKGENWVEITCREIARIRSFVFSSDDEVFAGTDEGMFYSNDYGDSWREINDGFKTINPSVRSIVISQSGNIFAGTIQEGVYHSIDKGKNWLRINEGLLYPPDIYSLAINSDGYLFAGVSKGIFRSSDNGENWIKLNGFPDVRTNHLLISPDKKIFAGTSGKGLYQSSNNGNTWEAANNGLTDSIINSIIYSSNDHLFTGTNNGIFHSIDNGKNWTGISSLENLYVLSLEKNLSNHIYAGTNEGIFYSTDDGENWIQTTNLTQPIHTLAINSDDHIFAGSIHFLFGGKIFVSTDNGETWNENMSGLTNNFIRCLKINPDDYIFAGTDGGIFSSINPTTSIKDEIISPLTFILFQNYPNPFNPTTKIKYAVGSTQLAILKIYDVLGNEVSTLVNEVKPAGEYEVEFDGRGLVSGIYFYKLQTQNIFGAKTGYSSVRKMILLK